MPESRACDNCKRIGRETDDKPVLVDDMEVGKNAAPIHPNCRCAVAEVWVVIEGSLEPKDETIYDNLSGSEVDDFFKQQESYQKWYNGLEGRQKEAIFDYTLSTHESINSMLRYGYEKYREIELSEAEVLDRPYVEARIKERLATSNQLKTVFQDYVTDKSFKVYRGTRTDEQYFSGLVVGDVRMLDKGFFSTSLDKSEALNFANDGAGERYLLDIVVPKGSKSGVYISELSDMPEEKEFLIKPEAKFKVKAIERNSSGMNLICLEVVE